MCFKGTVAQDFSAKSEPPGTKMIEKVSASAGSVTVLMIFI
jgi:hypothetical protein